LLNTFNFNSASGVQTFASSGIINDNINWNINGTSNTVKLISNVNLGTGTGTFTVNSGTTLDAQGFVLSGSGTFTLAATSGTLRTSNTAGIASTGASGSIQTATRNFNAGNYEYYASAAQITGTGLPATVNNLKINNLVATPAGVTLTSATTVAGNLDMSNGLLILGTNNLTVSNNSTSSIINASASSFVVTNSTGQLLRAINTGANTYIFPIGDITGTTEYSPVSIAFTANSTARNLGFIVTDANHPQLNTPNAQVDYLSRYWSSSLSVTTGTYSYSPTFTYIAPSDVNGIESNIDLNMYNGTSWTEYSSAPISPSISAAAITESSGSLATTSQWTGRINNKTYTWNGSVSSSFINPANWTPTSGAGGPAINENVIVNTVGTNQLDLGTLSKTVYDFTLNGTGILNISSTGSLTVNGNFTFGGAATAILDSASTFNIASNASQSIPALNFGNLNIAGGDRILASSGTIGISGIYIPTSGTLTTTGSTISFNGTNQTIPSSTSYNNVTINGTGTKTINGNLTIGGNLNLNASTLDLANFTANRSITGGALTVSNGATLKIGGTNTFPSNYSTHSVGCSSIIEYSGTIQNISVLNTSQAYGNLLLSGSGTKTFQAATNNICGNFTTSGTVSVTAVSNLTIGGTLNIGQGTNFTTDAFVHQIAGDINIGGTLITSPTCKFTFNGTGIQNINSILTIPNLEINKPSGSVVLGVSDLNITNNLNFVNGILDIGNATNNITIGTNGTNGTITGAGAGKYINTNYAGAGALVLNSNTNTTYTFPVGDASNYTPISITLNTGAQAGAHLKAKTIDAVHPNATWGANYLSRYWSMDESGLVSGFNYNVSYSYNDADVNGSESMIYPYKLHSGTGTGAGWVGPYGSDASFPYGSYTQDATNNTFAWNGLINFSDITGGGGGTPQPITLLFFNANANGEKVDVSWSTASEIDNDYFEVQRSVNGKDFETINKITAAGNHNGILNYSSIDENPYNGISYYRLKQVDFDGTTSYSNITSVEIKKTNETLPVRLELYPNPSNRNDVKLSINGITSKNLIQLKLFSSNGSQVFSENSSGSNGSNPILIPTKNLSNGIYYLQINIDGSIRNMKLAVNN
jgi:hypothetical protein